MAEKHKSKFEIELPIKPHLKKYLCAKLKSSSDKIVISTKDRTNFSLYVNECLQRKRNYYYNYNTKEIDKFVESLNGSKVTLLLNTISSEKGGIFLNNEKIFYINQFLNNNFLSEMFCFIETQKKFYPRVVVVYAIDDFLSQYDVNEDDIPRESLVRTYNRKNNTK
jgi:hypothetical protein